ncbi:MAG TPA: toxin-antitoxin system HicB family antitoxin [Terriglobales bacterium]|nr:toxin-antitoxin system HicB family antitoxin [Terriglobales bacterium]
MRRSNFALRLQPSLLNEARKLAESEGVALNQLITVALAEKISALRTGEYFAERARRADWSKIERILQRVGTQNVPQPGDEIPSNIKRAPQRVRNGRKRRLR